MYIKQKKNIDKLKRKKWIKVSLELLTKIKSNKLLVSTQVCVRLVCLF